MQSTLWAGVKDNWRWEGVLSRGDNGEIRGAMGILIRRLPGRLPLTLMYAGRGPVSDPHDRAALADLTEGAKRLAKKYHSYELKLDPAVLSSDGEFVEIMRSLGYALTDEGKNFEGVQPRYVFRIDMQGRGEDEIMASFSQKTRYNIRLAVKKGVTVRLCGQEMVPEFAAIMRETGLRDGFITRPAEYFAKMLRVLGEHARLYMAFYEGKPVAGTLAIAYGDKVWYLYGASANEYRNVMPNYLLQWEMIRWAVELGARIYDFRGVSGDISEDNPLYGLYRFKKGFNGDFCEFTGEFNLVLNRAVYGFVNKAQRLYREIRLKRYMRKNKTE
jgi:lipid II:glycine glycyltransferase (peptidoglycan interpeptide bridge formation enzyme)